MHVCEFGIYSAVDSYLRWCACAAYFLAPTSVALACHLHAGVTAGCSCCCAVHRCCFAYRPHACLACINPCCNACLAPIRAPTATCLPPAGRARRTSAPTRTGRSG